MLLNNQLRISCDSIYRHPAVYWLLGDSLHPGGLSLTRRLGEGMGLSADSLVLDVATGKGTSARYLAKELGWRIIGLDLVEENLVQAQNLSSRDKLDVRTGWVRGDAQSLPVASGGVDGVICECSLSIFPDKARAVGEMARVLRPGGVVGISDVSCSTDVPAEFQGVFSRVACLADIRSTEEYCALLAEAGFVDIQTEDHGEELKGLVASIKTKLAPLKLLLKLGALKVPGLDTEMISRGKELLRHAEEMVHDGSLSYCLITARKPPTSAKLAKTSPIFIDTSPWGLLERLNLL